MNYPIAVAMPSGAVSLGPDVVCDGFLRTAKIRVQTHVHLDHMDSFETSKGCQQIIASKPTLRLLIAEFNADLPFRANVKSIEYGEPYTVPDSRISLVPSGHMLGAAQVINELNSGLRLGYSGDFQWPLDEVIQVDALVVDSTAGSPTSVREFSQGTCEEQFVGLLRRLLNRGPVHVKAHRGTLHRALQIITDEVDCQIIASRKLSKEADVYRDFGYTIGPLVIHPSPESTDLLRDSRYVRVFGTGDHVPTDLGRGSRIVLSAYFTRPDIPVVEYSDRAFAVAMSNHADFEGTLEYVKHTNAKFVVTDNARNGKGYELAAAIKQRLGIEAQPSSSFASNEWGG